MAGTTRVAIAGLGAIGRVIARRLADGLPGLELTAVAARDHAKAKTWLASQKITCPLVTLSDLPRHADLAVECAPGAILAEICVPMLTSGKRVMVLSAGALRKSRQRAPLRGTDRRRLGARRPGRSPESVEPRRAPREREPSTHPHATL